MPVLHVGQLTVREHHFLDLVASALDEAVALVDRAAIGESAGRAEDALPLRDEVQHADGPRLAIDLVAGVVLVDLDLGATDLRATDECVVAERRLLRPDGCSSDEQSGNEEEASVLNLVELRKYLGRIG